MNVAAGEQVSLEYRTPLMLGLALFGKPALRVISHEPRLTKGARLIAHSRRYGMAHKQSDTPLVLAPGCEELKCDVVGISKRQCRVVRRVHDATVGDAEFVQTDFPCL